MNDIINHASSLITDSIESQFLQHVDDNLLDPESKFFTYIKNRIQKTSIYHIVPCYEFSNKIDDILLTDFIRLISYCHFTDCTLDKNNLAESTKARAQQIACKLLIDTTCKAHSKNQFEVNTFVKYFTKASQYLIVEKKWGSPYMYHSMYGNADSIISKEFILMYPLLSISGSYAGNPVFIKLMKWYLTLHLLTDDIADFSDDINHKTLTYPISLFFNKTGKLPTLNDKLSVISNELKNTISLINTNIIVCLSSINCSFTYLTSRVKILNEFISNKGLI